MKAMLRVDVRQISGGGTRTDGTLPADDPVFDGADLALAGPVEVAGELRIGGGDTYHWQARLRATVIGECRRCLGRAEQAVDQEVSVVFSPDPDLQDDPGVYPLPAEPSTVDVRTAVREELVLCISAFPLCREGCRGLCTGCGADLNAGPCGCAAPGSTN